MSDAFLLSLKAVPVTSAHYYVGTYLIGNIFRVYM